MKVLISDALSEHGVKILQSSGLDVEVNTKLSNEELQDQIAKYNALVIRSATKVNAKVIEAAKNLKVVGRAGSGVDNVDLGAATKSGIVVMNTPGGNTITTAEHAFAMMVSLARKIPQATASMKDGKWEKAKFMGMELQNKVLGIVGLGQIGSYLVKLAQGASMKVIAHDPYLAEDRAREMGVELVDLQGLYRSADVISLHTTMTDETRHLIGAKAIGQMKDSVRIVNCARGGLVDEDALVEALKAGKVAGAAFDVFEKEPCAPDHPLLGFDNVILTPHIGASTTEAQESVAISIAEQVVEYLTKGVARGAVNMPSVPSELLQRIQPYSALAEKLGGLQSHLCEGGIERVTIEYKGDVANESVALITPALLKGLLGPILEDTVNNVNAPVIAKERSIEVREVRSSDAGDFTSLIRVVVDAGKKHSTVAGTLFGRKDPRVVELNGFEVDFDPRGHLLFVMNDDQPGVIGMVGRILGEHGINIARMECARVDQGGVALLILGLDSQLPDDVLDTIKSDANIQSAKWLKL